MSEGSVSAHLARLVLAAVHGSGADPARFADRPDLAPGVLADDLSRVSTATMNALWEQLISGGRGSSVGALVVESSPLGSLGVWDYLFAAGANLLETSERVIAYLPTVGDPAAERAALLPRGAHRILRHSSGAAVPAVVEAVEVFAVALYLRRMREASRKPITPVRITFRQQPPKDPRSLHTALGTREIDFGAADTAITFRDDDLRAPLPESQPGLGALLARHADLTLAAARPVPRWIDAFRVALEAAAEQDAVSLAGVAQRLALSPRTVQRRLEDDATTWRQELDRLRGRRELALLRDTALPVSSVAVRLGYSDARAYRRAVQRRHGSVPSLLREG